MKDGNDNACTHAPTVDSDKEWWAFIRGVTDEMSKSQPGLLITNSPYGMHRLIDVDAIHFGDVEPPSDSSIPTLGFIKD